MSTISGSDLSPINTARFKQFYYLPVLSWLVSDECTARLTPRECGLFHVRTTLPVNHRLLNFKCGILHCVRSPAGGAAHVIREKFPEQKILQLDTVLLSRTERELLPQTL